MMISRFIPAQIVLLATTLGVCETRRAQTSWAAAANTFIPAAAAVNYNNPMTGLQQISKNCL